MDANDKNSPLALHLFHNNSKSYLYGCMLPECLIMLKIRAFHHLSGIFNRYRTSISIVFFKYITPVEIVNVARISCFSIP